MAKPTLKEIKAKIAARKSARKSAKTQKYAKMRLVAAKAPEKLEKHLIGLADKFASAAEGVENLRENLGLVRASKQAPLKIRITAAKKYGMEFKRIAEEAPEKLADALAEAYNGLNDIAADIEMAAEQMGVNLNEAPVAEEEVAGGIIEEAKEEGESPEVELFEKAEGDEHHEEPEEEKEAAGGGSDAWVTDRDESGNPKTPEQVDVPRVAAGGGSDPWVTDRDEQGNPKAPAKADIPQVEVKAAKKVTPAGKSATGSL